jgi:hypothetical protein
MDSLATADKHKQAMPAHLHVLSNMVLLGPPIRTAKNAPYRQCYQAEISAHLRAIVFGTPKTGY